jgi:hypothetical protein
LQAILPENLLDGAPAGFAVTGHLGTKDKYPSPHALMIHTAHMNLNDEYLPYKHLIGQVILDVNITIKHIGLALTCTIRKIKDYARLSTNSTRLIRSFDFSKWSSLLASLITSSNMYVQPIGSDVMTE